MSKTVTYKMDLNNPPVLSEEQKARLEALDKRPDSEKIIKKFVAFTYNLHKNCVYHKDYSAGNILVFKNEKDEYDFSLVDINRMEFKPIDLELGLDNFAKLWLDSDNLQIIAKEYSKLSDVDEFKAINILKSCDKKLKDFVEMKRSIRGRK